MNEIIMIKNGIEVICETITGQLKEKLVTLAI